MPCSQQCSLLVLCFPSFSRWCLLRKHSISILYQILILRTLVQLFPRRLGGIAPCIRPSARFGLVCMYAIWSFTPALYKAALNLRSAWFLMRAIVRYIVNCCCHSLQHALLARRSTPPAPLRRQVMMSKNLNFVIFLSIDCQTAISAIPLSRFVRLSFLPLLFRFHILSKA